MNTSSEVQYSPEYLRLVENLGSATRRLARYEARYGTDTPRYAFLLEAHRQAKDAVDALKGGGR